MARDRTGQFNTEFGHFESAQQLQNALKPKFQGVSLCMGRKITPSGIAGGRVYFISHFHDNRQDHGAALGLFVQVVGQVALDGALDG